METGINDSMLDEFVLESREHLKTIEEDILNIEKEKDNPDMELINKVFRSIHSIKGLAGFFGMENINKLTHLMETILSMIRKGEMTPTLTIVDPLLKGVDTVNTMLDNVSQSNDYDINDIYNCLNKLLSNEAPSEIVKSVWNSKSLVDENGESIGFDLDEFSFNNLENSENLYALRYDLVDICNKTQNTPISLIRHLKESGTVINGRIKSSYDDMVNGIPNEPLVCHLLYSTSIDQESIERVTYLTAENIIKVVKDNNHKDVKTDVTKKENKDEEPESINPNVDSNEKEKEKEKETTTQIKNNSSIRINVDILDKLMTLAGELVLVRNQQLLKIDNSDVITRSEVQRLDSVTAGLQEAIMRTRMQPIGNVFTKFSRIVRDLGNKLNKEIKLDITGNDVELDKTILESLADPLTHLIRNCCDHGIEDTADRIKEGKPDIGHISLHAYHEGGQINIEIVDDGKGINLERVKETTINKKLKTEEELSQMSEKEILSFIMMPGFSTVEKVSDVSGRGVGMDVVKSNIDKLGGIIDIETKFGKGTKVHLKLPLTLTIIPCLIIKVNQNRYAIPQVNILELLALYDEDVTTKIECAGDREVYRLRNKLLPIVRLNEVLERSDPFTNETWSEIIKKYSNDQDSNITKQPASEIESEKIEHKPETHLNKRLSVLTKTNKKSQSLNFVVLKVGKASIGLIVDQVIGTEEIVVKPMHSTLKSLSCYSGGTIMGDGKVALILDVDGIRRHTGIELVTENSSIDENLDTKVNDSEVQTILLFKNGVKEQFAVALPLIKRIERIKLSNIEKVGQKEFITIDGVSTIIIRLDHYLKVSECEEKEEMYLLLPKYTKSPFGILVSSIIDINGTSTDIKQESYNEDGLLGTNIVLNTMTLFIDIYKIIEIASKSYFTQKVKTNDESQLKKRGLLVEDMSYFRQLIKNYLEADGYEVVTAENGNVAIDRVNDTKFDFLISDLDMPVMDGWDFIKDIRGRANLKNIPAIALTATDSEESKLRAKELGFDRYEIKLDREHLLTTVSGVLK